MGVDRPSRRAAVTSLVSASAALAASSLEALAARQPCRDSAAGTLVGTLPLSRAGAPVQPYGVKFGGRGLDARLVTDLSRLEPDRLITPNAAAFVRTECPAAVAQHRGPWHDQDNRSVRAEGSLHDRGAAEIGEAHGSAPVRVLRQQQPGKFRPDERGRVGRRAARRRALEARGRSTRRLPCSLAVSITTRQKSSSSTAGASWVIPLASLDRLGAFLAVRMNGEPLPLDHGRPVRLAVPGWYGCAWIKWVNEIRLVGAGEPATSQMKEFAGRTHQSARHDLARDYVAPEIEAAAVPDPRRTAPHRRRHRIPHRRHRLGRPAARRSPGDPLWRRWSVDAVFDLSRSGLVCHVVALGLPVAAGKAGQARHLPARPRSVCSAAPPRRGLLHAGSDYLTRISSRPRTFVLGSRAIFDHR